MSTAPYRGAREHLDDELEWLDARLELAVRRFAPPSRPPELEPFGGLLLDEEEVLDALRSPPDGDLRPGDGAGPIRKRRGIDRRKEATRDAGTYLPFLYLQEVLGLGRFQQRCLLLALAPELDGKYGRAFAYLQDDVTRKLPTVDLALALFAGRPEERRAGLEALGSGADWRRARVLHVVDPPDGPHPLLARRLKLDDRVVQFLLGSSRLDGRTSRWASVRWEPRRAVPPSLEDLLARLRRLLDAHFRVSSPGSLIVHLAGRYGSGRSATAEAAAAHLGLPTVWIDMRKLAPSDAYDVDVRTAVREALLQPAAVGVRHADAIRGPGEADARLLGPLVDAIRTYSRLTFLVAEEPWTPVDLFGDDTFLSLTCPVPGYRERARAWTEALRGPDGIGDGLVHELAGKFRFTPGQIRDAAAEARARAGLTASPEPRPDATPDPDPRPDSTQLHAACRNQASPHLGELARRIDPVFGWDDLVLPEGQTAQLREIVAHVRHAPTVMGAWDFAARFPLGRAVTALFAGGSGTGKTMAAEILAGDLELDLFKIDLSAVVSKYIGETEKNLSRIFREARNSSAILFFDEADALFGKRSEVKDSHDRYANVEIAYLLQRMEEHEDGVVILATNLKKNLDEAFVRRLRFIVDFPFPTAEDRARIWEKVFPDGLPVGEDVDFDFLGRRLSVSGGNIKNIGLRAAYIAARKGAPAVDMSCVIEAAKRELDKVGKLYTEEEFGDYGEPGGRRLDGRRNGAGGTAERVSRP